MKIEERSANIIINRAGGNTSQDAKNYRVSLPSSWMNKLGINEKHREVSLQFDGEAITIRLKPPTNFDSFVREAHRSKHQFLLLHFYDGEILCTKICADYTARQIAINNSDCDLLQTAFGVNHEPTWADYEDFLEERCIPSQRDGLKHYLETLGVESYDPLAIIRKTDGRMAEDAHWIKIVEDEL